MLPVLSTSWNILTWILANKSLTVVLLAWGGTAAWGWWSGYKEQQRLAEVAEIYQEAYADERERADKLDKLALKVDKRKKVIHAKTTEAVEGLYSIREHGEGTYAQEHLRVPIPVPVIDVMRLALGKDKASEDKRERSATKRALTRLREALSRNVPTDGEEVRETTRNDP